MLCLENNHVEGYPLSIFWCCRHRSWPSYQSLSMGSIVKRRANKLRGAPCYSQIQVSYSWSSSRFMKRDLKRSNEWWPVTELCLIFSEPISATAAAAVNSRALMTTRGLTNTSILGRSRTNGCDISWAGKNADKQCLFWKFVTADFQILSAFQKMPFKSKFRHHLSTR